jgi:hypothetical protein
MQEVTDGTRAAITGADWTALILISVVLPAILTIIIGTLMRKAAWIKDGDLKLD